MTPKPCQSCMELIAEVRKLRVELQKKCQVIVQLNGALKTLSEQTKETGRTNHAPAP